MTKNNSSELETTVLINENAIGGLAGVDEETHPTPTISAGNLHKVAVFAVAKHAEEMLRKLKDETDALTRESLMANTKSTHLVRFHVFINLLFVSFMCVFI